MSTRPPQRALIFGINGQDGSLLADYLTINTTLEVFGTVRSNKAINLWRLRELKLLERVHTRVFELSDVSNVRGIIEDILPDFIYVLAGYTFTVDAATSTVASLSSNLLFPVSVLEAVRDTCPHAKILLANSIYSLAASTAYQCVGDNISLSYIPSIYSYSKRSLLDISAIFDRLYPLNIYSVILANHESHLRGSKFVTMKIISTLLAIKNNPSHKPLMLGDINAVRDWSLAVEFVEGFHKLLNNYSPGTYIFGRGVQESVKRFLETTLYLLGFNYEIIYNPNNVTYYSNGRVIAISSTPENSRSLDPTLPMLSGYFPANILHRPMTDLPGIISAILTNLS